MSRLSARLQSLQTEINEMLGLSSLQTASNIETDSLVTQLEKDVSELKAAVYKHLYKSYGVPETKVKTSSEEGWGLKPHRKKKR